MVLIGLGLLNLGNWDKNPTTSNGETKRIRSMANLP